MGAPAGVGVSRRSETPDRGAPRALDEGLFRRVLGGLACREYEACAEAVPAAFGLSRSTVSRRLDGEPWIALFLDGKRFAEDALVIAVGVTSTGTKVPLGFVQTATENRATCAAFLRRLIERGFAPADGPLVVLDGAKGLRAAVEDVWGARAQVQRCQWHKRENVVGHLPKRAKVAWRRRLQATPSSSALCASIGPATTSPIA